MSARTTGVAPGIEQGDAARFGAMLTVSQLSKSFAGRALFDDVALQVNRGDRIGLVGPGKILWKLPFWQSHVVNVFVLVRAVTEGK